MIKFTIVLLKKIGVDRAIGYTILARILQAVGGITTIFFIVRYLDTVEQGFYYTFGSIIAIQIFFELGLSNIITQFVAHETANLKWDGNTKLVGDEKSLSRLASLLQFCVKWFSAIAIFLFFGLLIAGFLFFTKYEKSDSNVVWQSPWAILAIITALDLIVSPILAFFAGLGLVAEVAKIRLVQQACQLFSLYLFLIFGFKLYSSPLATSIAFLIVPLWLLFTYKKKLLINIWKSLGKWKVSYKVEIFPFQWKIALSWISGYFIFQLFNPVVFATEGAIVAGQMGMTLAILSGVLSIPLSWINTKVPLFSSLIAKKEYRILDSVFNRTLLQSCLVCLFALLILNVTIVVLRFYQIPIANRFLPFKFLLLLSLATFVNQFVSSLATYLRCHKQEPFLLLSIVMGILTTGSTFIFGHIYGVAGIVVGYTFLTVVVSLAWAYYIFTRKKEEWHK